jgi:hypothetical protein
MKKIVVFCAVFSFAITQICFGQISEDVKQQITDTYIHYAEATTVEQRLQYKGGYL